MNNSAKLNKLDFDLLKGIEDAVANGKAQVIDSMVTRYQSEAVRTLEGTDLQEALHTTQVLHQVFRITLPVLTQVSSKQ